MTLEVDALDTRSLYGSNRMLIRSMELAAMGDILNDSKNQHLSRELSKLKQTFVPFA